MNVSLLRVPFTAFLIIFSIVVFAVSNLLGYEVILPLYISEYINGDYLFEVKQGQLWRLVTPAFVHYDIFHIIFNLLWVWEFARRIEILQGRGMIIVLFLFTAIISNLAQYHFVGPNFGGMSGVVYGLLGYSWLIGRLKPRWQINVPKELFYFLLAWLALGYSGLFEKFLGVGIANTAHLAGLLAGLGLAALVALLPNRSA